MLPRQNSMVIRILHHKSRRPRKRRSALQSQRELLVFARERGFVAAAVERLTRTPSAPDLEEAVLVDIEEWGEFGGRNISRRLAEDGPARAGVKHAMVRDRQGLPLAARRSTPQLDVTAPLREDLEPEPAQYRDNFSSREPPKPGQVKPPTQRSR
jgi:hypothetical protein